MMIGTTVLLLALIAAPDDTGGVPTAIEIQAGYGFSAYNHKPDATSSGFYVALEHIWELREWFMPRAYAGTLITFADKESCGAGGSPCDVSNKIGFVGAKARAMAPLPYIGPYFEVGGGVSVGSIKTLVLDKEDVDKKGLFGHVEFGFGLSLGREHEVDLGLSWLWHPSQQQIGGTIAAGVRIPL